MDSDKETNKIFIFGLFILFAWMIVIIICASPTVAMNDFNVNEHEMLTNLAFHYLNVIPIRVIIVVF
ncbi:Vacuolar membrane protease [Dirofilaria immitis]